ncbi:MAG: hypothetical protein P8129_20820, partial [Anaerolineae bacterium]
MHKKQLPGAPAGLEPALAPSTPQAPGWIDSAWLLAAGDEEKETVRTRRRRRSTPAGPGGRERAEAPSRRRPGGQAPTPSRPATTGGSGRPPSRPPQRPFRPSGGGGPTIRLSPIMIVGLLVLACICGALYLLFGRGGGLDVVTYDTPSAATRAPLPTEPARPTNTPRPFVAPVTSGQGQTWLVMLYQDAVDKILEQDIYFDLNEAERVGST